MDSTPGAERGRIRKRTGRHGRSEHARALASGTSAIHMALKAAGVGRGDIVLCQDLTFAATVNPVIYQNATPVFIDSDLETWNMDPLALEIAFQRVSKRKP